MLDEANAVCVSLNHWKSTKYINDIPPSPWEKIEYNIYNGTYELLGTDNYWYLNFWKAGKKAYRIFSKLTSNNITIINYFILTFYVDIYVNSNLYYKH